MGGKVELAVHSGDYADYSSPYRLGYFLQTVAANSLLVHAPGETLDAGPQRGPACQTSNACSLAMCASNSSASAQPVK